MTVVNLTDATVSGTYRAGQVLTTTDGTWSHDLPNLSFEYAWLRCDSAGDNCSVISGATSKTYQLTSADVGSTVRSRVSAFETADPDPPPDPGGDPKLRWAPPALSSPTTVALTNTARTIGQGSGDLRITAQAADLNGYIGQIIGYNDVQMIAGAITGGSAGSSGHVVPRSISGTFHMEGWKLLLTVNADAVALRELVHIMQLENCHIKVTGASPQHADCVQMQLAMIDDLRVDRVTIETNYQGFFLATETRSDGLRDRLTHGILSRVLCKPNVSAPGTYFWKQFPPRPNADPIGTIELYDFWMPNASTPGMRAFPNAGFQNWAGGTQKYGNFVTTKVHPTQGTMPFVRFSTSADTVPVGTYAGQQAGDCGIRGDGGIWLYNDLSEVPDDVGCAGDVGRSYTSPGYL